MSWSLSTEQEEQVYRFLDAFKRIEGHLRYHLRQGDEVSFSRLVSMYEDQNPVWGDRSGELLRSYASLRNVLVHKVGQDVRYLSVPVSEVVEQIENIRDQLIDEERVIPQFQRSVTVIDEQSTLADVMQLINQYQFSQFPIVAEDGSFQGLLTENGITRWLAQHTTQEISLVEFNDVQVTQVLAQEEDRHNVSFVSRKMKVNDALNRFGHNPVLEALLITDKGKSSEKFLGIITRWDVLDD